MLVLVLLFLVLMVLSILGISYDDDDILLWDIAAHKLLYTLPQKNSQEIPLAFNSDDTVSSR